MNDSKMCLLAISYQACDDAPLLVAANREEFYARPSLPPTIQEGPPRVLCGVDARAGGTWLGVNEHGVVAAVTNRRKPCPPAAPRSRGLLCRELLDFASAREAADYAMQQLASGAYDGANFACLGYDFAAVIHAGQKLEMIALRPGLHLLTAGDLDDECDPRQRLARELFGETALKGPEDFVVAARSVCSHYAEDGPSIIIRRPDRGTVSSVIFVLSREAARCQFHFAPGPPDRTEYQDLSPLLRATLL
jgi:uncharacterized protein with NRDE domain